MILRCLVATLLTTILWAFAFLADAAVFVYESVRQLTDAWVDIWFPADE